MTRFFFFVDIATTSSIRLRMAVSKLSARRHYLSRFDRFYGYLRDMLPFQVISHARHYPRQSFQEKAPHHPCLTMDRAFRQPAPGANAEQVSPNRTQTAHAHQRCTSCTRRTSIQPATPHQLCVTFPTRFSKTYKRTFPEFAVHIRPYISHISPCAFSRKTAEKANRPNTRPPQELQSKKNGLCHYMSPWICCRSSPEIAGRSCE